MSISKKNLRTNQGYTDLLILDIDTGGIVVIFAKKQEKIWKKIFRNEIRFFISIENEVFHVYALNRSIHKHVLIDC